ncbi:MAG: chemotaxis protein CheW [Thermoanaerobaculia bacterium]
MSEAPPEGAAAAIEAPAQPPASLSFLTFRAGGRRFGVPIDLVREAARVRRVVPLPGSPDAIAGVVLVRGEPLGVVDVARATSVGPVSEADCQPEPGMLIVLESHPFALWVEKIDGVEGILPERIGPPPAGSTRLTGAVMQGEQVLGLLDVEAVISEGTG